MKYAVTVLAALLVSASIGWATAQAETPRVKEHSRETRGAQQQDGGSREEVKAVQEALREHGQNPGPIDGVMGPKTQAALREFQRSEGLPETGRIDPETMAKLGATAPDEQWMERRPQEGMERAPQERMPQERPQEQTPQTGTQPRPQERKTY